MRTHASRLSCLHLVIASALGFGLALASPLAANAADGDASAVPVDVDGTLTPLDPATNDPLSDFVLDQTIGQVAAPPDASFALPNVALQADLGPHLGGLQDVFWFDGLAAQASTAGTSASASASVDEVRMNSPQGALTIRGISSTVACSEGGATASYGSGMTIDLAGTAIPVDPSGTTVIDFFDPPVPGYHMVITLTQSASTTATTGTATGLTILIDEEMTGIIRANATITVAQSSCTAGRPDTGGGGPAVDPPDTGTDVLAETGGTIPVAVLPTAAVLVVLGSAALVAARRSRRAAEEENLPTS